MGAIIDKDGKAVSNEPKCPFSAMATAITGIIVQYFADPKMMPQLPSIEFQCKHLKCFSIVEQKCVFELIKLSRDTPK